MHLFQDIAHRIDMWNGIHAHLVRGLRVVVITKSEINHQYCEHNTDNRTSTD